MNHDFFLSYTRANNDAFLKKFFTSLCDAIVDVRTERKLPVPDDVGFFDQRQLELGEDWDASLVQGIQSSNVFVAVASNEYFKSEYCGKEWQLFHQRLSTGAARPLPPLIKPIYWTPVKLAALPPGITEGQMLRGDPAAVENIEGYKFLLKHFVEQEDRWNGLIRSLAEEIVSAAEAYPLKPLDRIATLKDTPSAFQGFGPAPQTGPKRVKFAYMAADPASFGAARNPLPYQESGGADWKPFNSPKPLHQELQVFVTGRELDFTSDELRVGPDFIADIDEAETARQLVVLFVDGWSLQWDREYQRILGELDRKLGYHWCVMLPTNQDDPDEERVRPKIDAAIAASFGRHANLAPNPLFFRTNIKSTEDLKRELADVLLKLKEEVKKRAIVEMPIPAGPSRSVVRGPAARG
jgi:FxsC-like protein